MTIEDKIPVKPLCGYNSDKAPSHMTKEDASTMYNCRDSRTTECLYYRQTLDKKPMCLYEVVKDGLQ